MTREDWVTIVVSVLAAAISLGTMMRGYINQIDELQAEVRRLTYRAEDCEWARKGDAIRARSAP